MSEAAVPPPGGQWDPAGYARNAGFVPTLGNAALALLRPRPGERILDLGCGDGVLTAEIAASGARVVGVDGSAAMVEAAKGRGLDARVMNGHALSFAAEFDAVFSNAALHWMTQPDAVIAGVARALRPGGRFVAEMGGFGNVAAIQTAFGAVLLRRGKVPPRPWYFPTPEEQTARLTRWGFTIESIDLIHRPTPLPTGLAGWLQTFAQPFLAVLPAEEHQAALAEVTDLLIPALRDESGNWIADYVRLRFAARLGG